jgi:hypothetical protein
MISGIHGEHQKEEVGCRIRHMMELAHEWRQNTWGGYALFVRCERWDNVLEALWGYYANGFRHAIKH